MKISFLRILLFLLCLPSGGILLLKAYGIADMHKTALAIFLPSLLLLLLIWVYLFLKKDDLKNVLLLGAVGGLLGTFGYDLIRIPIMLLGNRIFAPINMYGMWLTDATASSTFTDLVGWLYHFSNGITFGIMYALVMKGKNLWWAVLYALLLETIFVVSPFGELFGLTSKPMSLFAAYLGHVAYGYPLGKMVQNYKGSMTTLNFFRKGLIVISVIAITFSAVLWGSTSGDLSSETVFRVNQEKITPGILRVDKGATITFQNDTGRAVSFYLPLLDMEIKVIPEAQETKKFEHPGIYHVVIKDLESIKGAFILYEPVEQYK
ncbi:hypothetical protein [Spongiimicrobium sp. 3-5]|uniref:hypothetical protein n=1 Tax=Spongiimicrobium sp. 3-5 TaxID=3332596 RepID=UPI00398066FB